MKTLISLLKQMPACTGCSLFQSRNHVVADKAALKLDQPPSVMLVAGTPHAEDDANGVPCSSAYGQKVSQALNFYKIKRQATYFTYLVKCIGQPNYEQMQKCLGWFHAEFSAIRPKVIIALDLFAHEVITGSSEWPKIGKSKRGSIVNSAVFGVHSDLADGLWSLTWHKIAWNLFDQRIISKVPEKQIYDKELVA